MKQVLCVIMFAATTGSIVFSDEMGFTGEWIVESNNDSDSGIAVVIEESSKLPPGLIQVYPDGTALIAGKGRVALPQGAQYAFTVIPAGTFFDFTVNDSELTGSIIRQRTEKPILNGKISGDKITFTVRETLRENIYNYSYTGTLSNDRIQFDVRPSANGGNPFKLTVRRAPD